MTTTTIKRGSDFSETTIYDVNNWGDVTDDQAQSLGDAVVAKFDELANAELCRPEHSESISLIAGTGEVLGDFNVDYPIDIDDILDDCLTRAHEFVMTNLDKIINA